MSVDEIIRKALPRGKPYRIVRAQTGISGTHVLRIVTPAWKSLPMYQRVLKVTDALYTAIPAKDRAKILRVSVMTEEELARLQKLSPALTRPSRIALRR